MTRRLAFAMAFLGVGLLAAGALTAAEEEALDVQKQEGTLAMVADDHFTLTDDEGTQHEFTVNEETTIKVDGEEAKLEDLKAGQFISVTYDRDADRMVAKDVEAKTATPDEADPELLEEPELEPEETLEPELTPEIE